MTDEELAYIITDSKNYSHPSCRLNDYIIFQDSQGKLIGPYVVRKQGIEKVGYTTFDSMYFKNVKPKDLYQVAYMHSIENNQLTFATGPAGSGKSLIGLAYGFQELLKGRVSKIIIFTNPYIARSAVKLGFLPGDKIEKLLETSIGSILASKLGDRMEVEKLINYTRQLVLMPLGDCRGYEVPEDAFVYFTEAQNTNIYLMQLFLQRLNDSCKVIVEGDIKSQVDFEDFDNGRNGLAKAIEVFGGEDYVGHIQLENNYRGRISRKAEEMM